VPIVIKPGNLKLLEPSGPVQGFTGIALPLPVRINIAGGVSFTECEDVSALFIAGVGERGQEAKRGMGKGGSGIAVGKKGSKKEQEKHRQ
jgi:hypothetical protein